MKTAGAAVYAVSGGQRRTLREVVATVEQAAGTSLNVEFGTRPYRAREVMHPWEGPGLPGWRAEVGLLDGLRAMIAEESVTGGV
jgi:nucleoside-diphosphate-sugar epimerase